MVSTCTSAAAAPDRAKTHGHAPSFRRKANNPVKAQHGADNETGSRIGMQQVGIAIAHKAPAAGVSTA